MSDLTPMPGAGFAPAPVNSTQWNAQVVQAAAEAQQRAVSDKRAQTAGMFDWVPDWVKTPVEWFGSFVHSTYTNAISRPLSTILMVNQIGSAEAKGDTWYERMGSSWGSLFDADTWDRAYQDSEHVSPGQALEFGIENFFGGDMKKALTAPVIYKPKDMAGKQIVDQTGKPVEINLNKTGLLWDNPDAVRAHFDEGIQKWVSGGLDAYISWYADPMVTAGRVAGAARNLAYVRPLTGSPLRNLPGAALAENLKIIPKAEPGANIEKNLQSSAFSSLGDQIMKNKERLGEDGFPEWVTHQNWAKNSADSGAIAAQLGKATDRADVDHILTVAMGDESAISALNARSKELGAMVRHLDESKKGALANISANPDSATAAKIQLQLSSVSQSLKEIDQEQGLISQKLAIANSMQSGMYYNPYLSPLASRAGEFARGLQTVPVGNIFTSPIKGGMALLYNNAYVRPVRVATGQSFRDVKSRGVIDVDDANSHVDLAAALRDSKAWTPDKVNSMVSDYITADRATKDFLIQQADQGTVRALAAKHGLTDAEADAIYSKLGGMKGQARDGRIYSTAYVETADGGRLRADHIADDGSLVTVSPVLNSQLQNTHILTDYAHMDRVLKLTAKPFQKLMREQEIQARAAVGGPLTANEASDIANQAIEKLPSTFGARAYKTLQVGSDMGDVMSKLWKFNVLLRMGYGPRAISDDFMGQVARLGAQNFFMDRVAMGGRNMILRNWNKTFNDVTGYEQQAASLESGIAMLGERAQKIQARIDRTQSYIPPNISAGGAEARRLASQRAKTMAGDQARLDDTMQQIESLKAYRNKIGETRDKLGDQYAIMPDGTAFARPFEGPQGQLFKNMLSGRRTIDSMMGGTAASMWNEFRKGDWREYTVADGDKYVGAYVRAVQGQLASDAAAQAVLRGEDLEKWFTTSAGRKYRNDSAMKNLNPQDHAERIESTVNNLLPRSTPELANIRDLVSKGASDKDVALAIKDAVSKTSAGLLPHVQGEGIAYNMGKGEFFDSVNSVIDKWYDMMNRLPSDVLSRNPLFFQLYRQHASDLWNGAKAQGVEKLSPLRQQQMEESARKLALKDVKRLTFNMDNEGRLAYAMRFVAPFWGPTQESFQRWGRIVADKPEILSRAAQIYTAPIKAGHAVDNDGNMVGEDGYATLPDGTRKLVPKDQMHIQFQAPQWLAKSVGMDQGSIIDMPINTLNLVLQNDPWYNPGTGPWVQLPANWTALRTSPSVGDAMVKLGVLQQVTPDMKSQLLGSGPKFITSLLGSEDKDQQQRDMAYLMQSEDYKWKTGMRKDEPTWQEIKDRTEHAAYLRGLMKTALPVSADFKDPYQFFRDQYQALQKADPKTADQVFLAKYGDAAFAFTGALTFDRKHLPATVEAVMKNKEYSYLTDADPDLAALIVKPTEGEPFSQTAYVQQMASGERTKLDAYDVMSKARENLGWAQYGKYMNILNARLRQAGFNSYDDPGAQAYKNQRSNLIKILTSPQINGVDNARYNPEFAKAFLTVDKTADERRAAAFRKLVTEKGLVGDPMRQDINGGLTSGGSPTGGLYQYMIYRDSLTKVLANRDKAGGSADINANSNRDLKLQFSNAVNSLRERNTMFESLHERWLVHDMFDHHNPLGSN